VVSKWIRQTAYVPDMPDQEDHVERYLPNTSDEDSGGKDRSKR
jgi:hypothetical protein